jgi:hypothetical protein
LFLELYLFEKMIFTNDKSGLAEIFNGTSPFGDGELEAFDGLSEGFDIPQMPEAPQILSWVGRGIKTESGL